MANPIPLTVAAFSGGKDSTAMVLAMRARGERIDRLFITPTGDELPDMAAHWAAMARRLGMPLETPNGPTLRDVVEGQRMIPNFRARFCTRMIKIVPAIAWVSKLTADGYDVTMCVGLRADEKARKGIIDEKIRTRFPLREYGMGLRDVEALLRREGVAIPKRTDCARCYHQRIGEWWDLWSTHPGLWDDACAQEEAIGHTYRTPGRDTWPTPLRELGAEFERGRVPASIERREAGKRQLTLFDQDAPEDGACRVCTL